MSSMHYHEDYPAVDQQQQLLRQGSFPVASNSAAHLADQIERGGARIEDVLLRLNCRYQSLFFLASWAVITSAVMATLSSLFHFALINLINSIFLLAFGCTLMVLDIPGSPRWAGFYRKSIRKYFRFLTRLSGKALWLLYLGCMTIVCLWPAAKSENNRSHSSSTPKTDSSDSSDSSGFFVLMSLLLGFTVMAVSFIGLFIALRKSLRLERVRRAILQSHQGNWPDVYRKYAVNDPSHGMQFEEFNRLASDYTEGSLLFDLGDLQIIYNALDEHQKSAINESEFGQWVASGAREDVVGHASAGYRTWMTYL